MENLLDAAAYNAATASAIHQVEGKVHFLFSFFDASSMKIDLQNTRTHSDAAMSSCLSSFL